MSSVLYSDDQPDLIMECTSDEGATPPHGVNYKDSNGCEEEDVLVVNVKINAEDKTPEGVVMECYDIVPSDEEDNLQVAGDLDHMPPQGSAVDANSFRYDYRQEALSSGSSCSSYNYPPPSYYRTIMGVQQRGEQRQSLPSLYTREYLANERMRYVSDQREVNSHKKMDYPSSVTVENSRKDCVKSLLSESQRTSDCVRSMSAEIDRHILKAFQDFDGPYQYTKTTATSDTEKPLTEAEKLRAGAEAAYAAHSKVCSDPNCLASKYYYLASQNLGTGTFNKNNETNGFEEKGKIISDQSKSSFPVSTYCKSSSSSSPIPSSHSSNTFPTSAVEVDSKPFHSFPGSPRNYSTYTTNATKEIKHSNCPTSHMGSVNDQPAYEKTSTPKTASVVNPPAPLTLQDHLRNSSAREKSEGKATTYQKSKTTEENERWLNENIRSSQLRALLESKMVSTNQSSALDKTANRIYIPDYNVPLEKKHLAESSIPPQDTAPYTPVSSTTESAIKLPVITSTMSLAPMSKMPSEIPAQFSETNPFAHLAKKASSDELVSSHSAPAKTSKQKPSHPKKSSTKKSSKPQSPPETPANKSEKSNDKQTYDDIAFRNANLGLTRYFGIPGMEFVPRRQDYSYIPPYSNPSYHLYNHVSESSSGYYPNKDNVYHIQDCSSRTGKECNCGMGNISPGTQKAAEAESPQTKSKSKSKMPRMSEKERMLAALSLGGRCFQNLGE